MKRLFFVCLFMLVTVVAYQPAPSQAQPTDIPLVMLINGDIWTWNPQTDAVVQLTTWRYNFKPVISPKGDWVAYKSWAQITVEAINANAPLSPTEPPGNIWLIDPRTGDAQRIAEQPADARFGRSDGDDRFIARSNPIWSPDGSQVAWTEFLFPDYSNRLVVYDVATSTSRTIVNSLNVGYEQNAPMDIIWGPLGIVYPTINYNSDTNNFEETYHFYSDAGREFNTVSVPVGDSPLHGFVWFTSTEQVSGMEHGVAVVNAEGLPQIINPNTGRITNFMGILVGYSSWQTPAQSAYVSFEVYNVDFVYGLTWIPRTSNGRAFDSIGISTSYFDTFAKMSMSPDGQSIAYIAEDGGVLVWTNGRLVQLRVSNAEALAWSPIIWTTNYPVSG